MQLTLSAGVSQHFGHLLVGGVLAQSAHDVGDLVVSHLVVSHSVEESESLPVVCEGHIALMKPVSACKLFAKCSKLAASVRGVGGWGGWGLSPHWQAHYVTTGQVVVFWG